MGGALSNSSHDSESVCGADHGVGQSGRRPSKRRGGKIPLVTGCVWLIMFVHGLLLGIQAWRNTPTVDEVAHLPAGLSHWQFGSFDLYRVNPPLIRMVAAIPLQFTNPKTDWLAHRDSLFARPEFTIGRRFLQENGVASFHHFRLARLTLIPVILLGGWVVHRWAAELYGSASGMIALILWCFCPNVLAWGAQITPDAGAASLGVLAGWAYRQWLVRPAPMTTASAGLTLGLAELAKSSWIILFGLWPLLWLYWRFSVRNTKLCRPRIVGLLTILLVGLYVLNLGYAFENIFQRLDGLTFISETLGGEHAHETGGNRFVGTSLGLLPVPLPANYVRGIDVQMYDFEQGKWSWLRGEQKKRGWWYYYLYGLLIKTPLGFLGLIVLGAIFLVPRRRYRRAWREEIILLVPALTLFVLVSSQTGFNRYLRYVLPAVPFIYIATARIGRAFALRHHMMQAVTVIGVTAGVAGSLAVFPYSMSYFNSAVGGPVGGRWHLLDANIDWGQDLLRLRHWLADHPEARPIRLEYFGVVSPELAMIDAEPVPRLSESVGSDQMDFPPAGWYAVSVNRVMGYRHAEFDTPEFTYFQKRKPVATIGYSIDIYRVDGPDDAVLNEYGR